MRKTFLHLFVFNPSLDSSKLGSSSTARFMMKETENHFVYKIIKRLDNFVLQVFSGWFYFWNVAVRLGFELKVSKK